MKSKPYHIEVICPQCEQPRQVRRDRVIPELCKNCALIKRKAENVRLFGKAGISR
jgi:hypothetical protein